MNIKPVYPEGPILISEADFNKYTSEWQRLLSNKPDKIYLNPYFKLEGASLYSVLYSRAAIINLLSTTGITNVKVKFCIIKDAPDSEYGVFNVALFGTTSNGIVKSAYYLGSPCTEDYLGGSSGGNVPDKLAEDWINRWRSYYAQDKIAISKDLFNTMFGFLQGYTYKMEDFLDAFYKNTTTYDEYLCFHFAVHEHYMPGTTDTQDQAYTFNTVLQGIDAQNQVSNNLFYDISSPCPPTC